MAFRIDRLSSEQAVAIGGPVNGPKLKRLLDKAFSQVEAEFGSLEAALERMGDFAPVTITADYTGTIDPPSQLPKTVQAHRYNDTTEVTDECDWSATLVSGDADVSINAGTGAVAINDISINSVVNVSSTRSIGGTISKPLSIYFTTSAPPTGTSGTGDTATATSFSPFNSTTYAAVSDELTVIVGAGGIVNMAAPLTLTTDSVAPAGTFVSWLVWQWWDGGAWVNQGTEADGGAYVSSLGAGDYDASGGSITANAQKTGLTPAASEKFRLMAKNDSGTRTMYLYGTASVVAS